MADNHLTPLGQALKAARTGAARSRRGRALATPTNLILFPTLEDIMFRDFCEDCGRPTTREDWDGYGSLFCVACEADRAGDYLPPLDLAELPRLTADTYSGWRELEDAAAWRWAR